MWYKVLIYVALVVLTVQVAVSNAATRQSGVPKTVSRSSGPAALTPKKAPCPCKRFDLNGVCRERDCPCPEGKCGSKPASSACECKKFDQTGKCIDENCACPPNRKCTPKNKASAAPAAQKVRGTRPAQAKPLASRRGTTT